MCTPESSLTIAVKSEFALLMSFVVWFILVYQTKSEMLQQKKAAAKILQLALP
jgi:hypothetical protein